MSTANSNTDATQDGIREGSSLHYSLLWTEAQARQRFYNCLTLVKALASTLDDVQEPQVAEKKIHWWHEELQRLSDGSARHPATRLNQEPLAGLASATMACLDIVSVASTQRFTPAQTTQASESELVRSFSARLALLSHALSGDEAHLDTSVHSPLAALAFARYDQLVRLPMLIHRGLPVFSDELYKQFDIRPSDLSEHIRVAASAAQDDSASSKAPAAPTLKSIPIVTEKPGRQRLLAHAIECNHAALSQALQDTQTVQLYRTAPLLPLWRLLVLRKHQLDLWKKNQPDLLRERTTLTPLSKFYRAWQNRR